MIDIQVRYVTMSELAEVSTNPHSPPFDGKSWRLVLDWPKHIGSVNYTPHGMLFAAYRYLTFQLFMIKSFIDSGEEVHFPDYPRCRELIRTWGRESMWTGPELVRNLLDRLFEPLPPYRVDVKPFKQVTNIVLHYKDRDEERLIRDRTPYKKIKALEDDEDGRDLLLLYLKWDCVPVFYPAAINDVVTVLSCGQLAFKDETDAILHQSMIVVEEHEKTSA